MKIKFLLFLLLSFFVFPINAQLNFLWAKKMGGTGNDHAMSSAIDASGNVYTTGHFVGTADFDPSAITYNLTSAGMEDVFISKLDASGNFIWAKRIGGIERDYGLSLTLDSAGNVYTTGYFADTVDFDPGLGIYDISSYNNSYDVFINKLNSSGNFVWTKRLGGISYEQGSSISIDNAGNIYTTGYFNGTTDFDPNIPVYNLTTTGSNEIFITKLDSSGSLIWAKSLGGTGADQGNSITVDIYGNIYLATAFQNTADFDPGSGVYNLTSSGSLDIGLCKLDSSGSLLWAKNISGTNIEIASSIVVDAFGDIYTTGYFFGTVDFDPGPTVYNLTAGTYSYAFVNKLDTSGNFLWAKSMGGTSTNEGLSIALDNSGNIYTTGFFEGTVDFDPGSSVYNLTSSAFEDVFINKLDNSGAFIWAEKIGGTGTDLGQTVLADASGNIYLTGTFKGTADFNPGVATYNLISSPSALDCFVVKFNSISVGIPENLSAGKFDFIVYPNPCNGIFTLQMLLQSDSKFQIEIVDVTGQLIKSISYSNINSGENSIPIDATELSKGIYFIKIYNEDFNKIMKLIISPNN